MRKLLAISRICWQQTVTYRAETFVWFVLDALPLVYLISLWKSLERTGGISREQAGYLTFYYIATIIISRITHSEFDTWAIDSVKDGRVSVHLLKPFSYQSYLFLNELTYRISGLLFLAPSVLLVLPIIKSTPGLDLSPATLAILLPLLFGALLQRFFVSYLIFISAFFLEQAKFLSHFKWMLEGIIGGLWLPISFLPQSLQNISVISPFYSWYYLPIQIMTRRATTLQFYVGYSVAIFWVLILLLLSKVLWKRAIHYYSAVGA